MRFIIARMLLDIAATERHGFRIASHYIGIGVYWDTSIFLFHSCVMSRAENKGGRDAVEKELREQDVKAFLYKVVIVGENVRKPLLAHGLHRDAIRETIFLVQARLVQAQPCKEGGAGLWQDNDKGIGKDAARKQRRAPPDMRGLFAKEREEFRQDFVRGV